MAVIRNKRKIESQSKLLIDHPAPKDISHDPPGPKTNYKICVSLNPKGPTKFLFFQPLVATKFTSVK